MLEEFNCETESMLAAEKAGPDGSIWPIFYGLLRERGKLQAAFSAAWRPVAPFIKSNFGLSDDEAEEIEQRTAIKAWQNFHTYNPNLGRFSTWCCAIAKNEARLYLRHVKRQERMLLKLSEREPEEDDPDASRRLRAAISVCIKWRNDPNPYKAKLAQLYYDVLTGQKEFIHPTGTTMANILGLKRGRALYQLWLAFRDEIINLEQKLP